MTQVIMTQVIMTPGNNDTGNNGTNGKVDKSDTFLILRFVDTVYNHSTFKYNLFKLLNLYF